MPEVPDHLVPMDGLTDSHIRLAGLDTHENDPGVTVRFDIYDEDDEFVGTLRLAVPPTSKGTVDAMIANAYAGLSGMLRQWLYEADQRRQAYENK